MATWTVQVVPVSDNGETTQKNKSGLSVVLTDGKNSHEMCRVAFDRSAVTKKEKRDVPFEAALEEACDKAQVAADAVNAYLDELERARAEDDLKAADKMRELLGKPSSSLA